MEIRGEIDWTSAGAAGQSRHPGGGTADARPLGREHEQGGSAPPHPGHYGIPALPWYAERDGTRMGDGDEAAPVPLAAGRQSVAPGAG